LSGAGALILVAEDQPLASLALRAQLEALDYRVLAAHDGDEALALGACFPVQVGLFDFRMPRRNGVEAAIALFAIAPTPIVLLSGFDPVNLPEPIPRPPIFASLTKPADLNDLRSALQEATAGFARWAAAEPGREALARQRLQERATIAAAIQRLADGGAPAVVAERLIEQARVEERPLIDLARDSLAAGP
jgi:CheY-like chemotaxis protein